MYIMKKVSGYVSIRNYTYNYEFYVDDDTTDEEISKMVFEREQLRHGYVVKENCRCHRNSVCTPNDIG